VLAALPTVGLFAQPLWGNVADRTGARSALLAFLTLAASLGYGALGRAGDFAGLLTTVAGTALFSAAVIPVSVSIAFAALRDDGPHAFGLARVWGTLGYLLFVVAFPWILDRWQEAHALPRVAGGPSEPGLQIMFATTALCALAAAASALFLPRDRAVALRAGRGDWRRLLREPAVRRLLFVGLASFFFLQGPMGIFPLLIRERGGDIDMVRSMWVAMLFFEVPLIALSGTGLRRLGARGLLAMGIGVGGLRWAISAVVTDTNVLWAVQLLHGVTVTGLLLGGPLYLEAVVPEHLRSTAQSLFAMFAVGAGGLTSNIAAGWLLDHAGVTAPYLYGGLAALLLALSLRWVLPVPRRLAAPAAN
jgi:PPP family 3-phenylpropionic acid transporter